MTTQARIIRDLPAQERPLAAAGLTSYRCKSRFGWIMIGAKSHADAMAEAKRSTPHPKREDLQVWNGAEYVPC